MIGYVEHVYDRTWKPCSQEKFYEILSSPGVAHTIRRVRSGNKGRKNRLPAFIFGGSLDKEAYRQHCEECERTRRQPQGSRKEEFLTPTGLFCMDFDRTSGSAFDLHEKFLATMRREGIATEGFLALSHRSPGGHGLRLVLRGRPGSTIADDQQWIAGLMGEEIDEVCKDFSRLSFAVTMDDVFFVDNSMLFGPAFEGIYTKHPRAEAPLAIEPSAEVSTKPAEAVVADGAEASGATFDEAYDGIPYATLVSALADQLGGVPAHGSRNNFIFSMACHLRYVCNDDPSWIAQVLPTYGEDTAKWQATIRSACNRSQQRTMPQVVKRAIRLARVSAQAETAYAGLLGEYPPAMPDELPPLIDLLVSRVPAPMKPAVAHAVFPALGAHLGGVKFRYIDNVLHEATFMCCLLARMSTGKSAVNKPIEYILADIVERDNENRRREQAWKDSTNQRGANKEKPKRPENLCIQVLVSDMTNAAFVQRLNDAQGKFLYTSMDELELLDQLKTSSRSNQVSQIIRLAFDCGLYGQERVGTSSVTARVQVKWNWNASSTIQKGKWYFRNSLADGTLSRINFCTIPHQRGADLPVYGTYDDEFAEALQPYIDHLNAASGIVTCPEAEALAHRLLQENAEVINLSDDEVYEGLSYRANVIAYLKAMTLFVANGGEWDPRFEAFVQWSERYDLWCKMHFFGSQMQDEMDKETPVRMNGPQNMLELLPNRFSYTDAANMRRQRGKPEDPSVMLRTWIKRGYIELDIATDEYFKTQDYLKRHGQ